MNDPQPPGENPFGSDADSKDAVNPFHSPSDVRDSELNVPAGADPVIVRSPGTVRQVRPIAICMIVHGLLISLLGLVFAGMGIFFMNISPEMLGDDAAAIEPMQGIMSWGYAIFGFVVLLIGMLTIFAGVRNLSFRSRTFGIVMLSVGVLTSLGCYCAPTAIGLAIWGLIAYLNPSVARAFELVAKGTSTADILAMVRKPGT